MRHAHAPSYTALCKGRGIPPAELSVIYANLRDCRSRNTGIKYTQVEAMRLAVASFFNGAYFPSTHDARQLVLAYNKEH